MAVHCGRWGDGEQLQCNQTGSPPWFLSPVTCEVMVDLLLPAPLCYQLTWLSRAETLSIMGRRYLHYRWR